MYNKRSAMQWCGWRVIITRMTETKVYCHWDDVKERVSLLLLGRTLCYGNTQVQYLLHFILLVSEKIWCAWGLGIPFAMLRKKIIGFTCSAKSLWQLYFHQIFIHDRTFYIAIYSVFFTHISKVSCYREWKSKSKF